MKIVKRIHFFLLAGVFFTGLAAHASPREFCVQDEFGEQAYLKLLPHGLISGHTEYNGEIVGTVFGSYKRLSRHEVMIGGDINNDCRSGLFPGKTNATIDMKTLTGHANGFVFICDEGTVVPFVSNLSPCD